MGSELSFTVKRTQSKIQDLIDQCDQRNGKFLTETAREVKDDIRASWSGRYPPASSAGQTPAVRSGDLDQSVKVEDPTNTTRVSRIRITSIFYGGILENGSKSMAARPWLKPAMMRAKRRLKDKVKMVVITSVTK